MGFGRALLGGLGLIKYDIPFKPTDFDDFVKELSQPCIILTRSTKHSFFGGGISAVTKSPWQHSVIYLGKSLGERARKLYPELMGKRMFYFRNQKLELNPIPKKSCYHEVIESGMYINFGELDRYNKKDEQIVAWMKPYTPQQVDDILYRAMLMHGMPYDTQEIASFISDVENPEDGKIILENGQEFKIGMKVCSSYLDYVFDLPLDCPSPGDINKHCKDTVGYSRLTNNC